MQTCAAELIWYAPGLLPLSVAVGAAAVAVALLLYTPQVRMLDRRWRWVLPGLRVLTLAALAASVLKPVVRREQASADAGAVLILVDRSRSMSVRDLSGLPARVAHKGYASVGAAGALVDLADDLGMLPPKVREESATGLQAGIRRMAGLANELAHARRELDFAKLSGRGEDAAAAKQKQVAGQLKDLASDLSRRPAPGPHGPRVLPSVVALRSLDAGAPPEKWAAAVDKAARDVGSAQSEADRDLYRSNADVRAACDALAKLSRFELVERALTDPAGGLLGKFPADVPLFGFTVAEDARPLPLRGGGKPVRRIDAAPDGLRTDLTGSLRAALDRLKAEPLQAVVVFTDGRQVGGDPTVASGLSASGVPIFAVLVAPGQAPPAPADDEDQPPVTAPMTDVAVAALSVPAAPFVGETVTVRATVLGQGLGGATVDVNLDVDGKRAATKKVALRDGVRETVAFPYKLDAAGVREVTVSVPPVPDEASVDNNALTRRVKVLADKVKVAAVAGTAGWDYQYVRNALARTPWVKLDDQILNADAETKSAARLNLTTEQILGEDLVMLFNVPVSALSAAQWDAVYRLVNERGGSVLIAGGDPGVLAEYSAHPLLSAISPFPEGVRPAWRTWPGKDAFFHLTPAPDAGTLDALRLDGGDPDPRARWAELPGFYRYLPVPEPKEGSLWKEGTRALLVERDSNAAVLTESRVGRGRALFFGADETWRWRQRVGERDQDRFWLQLVRYAADEPYAVNGANVSLDADKVSAEPGAAVRVRARAADAAGAPSAAPDQRLDVLENGRVVRTVRLHPAGPAGLGRYEGTLAGLPAGDYTLSATGPAGGAPATLPLKVAPSGEEEMADLSGSEQPMADLAADSGGAVLTLNQVGSIPDRIARARAGQTRLTDRPLWDSPWLFAFVLACLAAEWGLRKRLGMV